MKYNLVNWSGDYRNDGIAYMNQRIQEMLSHFADHVFAVPVCNTYILVKEFLHTFGLVKSGAINAANLNVIMEEFQESFRSDIVIKKHFDKSLSEELLARINSATLEGKFRLMDLLHNKLAAYNEWCKEDLREYVLQEKEKKKIECVLKSFIAGLIACGYSRTFIYFYNNEVFNNSPVCSEQSLDRFLDRFDFIPRKYNVVIGIDKDLLRFQTILEQRLGASFSCEEEAKDYKTDRRSILVKFSTNALDASVAANITYEKLKVFIGFYKFLNDQKAKWICRTCMITDQSGNTSFLKINKDDFSFSRKTEGMNRGEFVEMIVSKLLVSSPQAFPVFHRIVDLHNTSIESNCINNSFLNLWSILEVLLVYDHSENKIDELNHKLLPILQHDYMKFVFEKLCEDIVDNIPAEKLDIVVSTDKLQSNLGLLPSIILLPKYDAERQQLINLMEEYPIIRSRIYQYHEMYSHKKAVLTDIRRFSKRVEWHIHRLYRARNAIVHSGNNMGNIKELSRHLHNYVDEAVMEILFLLLSDDSISSIDNAVIDIQLRVELLLKHLSSKEAINYQDIIALFIPPIMQKSYADEETVKKVTEGS